MNTARLVFGWLFLAGFTAAGTYYAMDEMDQRVGLARFQLHEKLGLVRYAAVPQPGGGQQPVTPQPITPQPVNPQLVNPQPVTPQPVNPQPVTPQPVTPQPVTPQPVTPQPVTPQPVTPQPVTPQPVTPQPVTPQPVTPQPATPKPISPQPQSPVRPPVDEVIKERLIEVKSRAEAIRKTWESRQPMTPSGTRLPLRQEIQGALSAMRRFTLAAQEALGRGDTNAARQFMDQAEKQMEILKQFDE